MASGPIISWQIDGETVETVSNFILGAPKSLQMMIAAMKLKDAYSLEGKLWPTLDSIFKSRDITLPTKVCLVKVMVFTVVINRCESWIVKKAERRRIDAFELVLEKTLELAREGMKETDKTILEIMLREDWFSIKH